MNDMSVFDLLSVLVCCVHHFQHILNSNKLQFLVAYFSEWSLLQVFS